MDLDIDLGFYITIRERVRLADIDTPEIYGVPSGSEEYERGMTAKAYVERRLAANHNEVVVETGKLGKWRRWIATLYLADSEISLNQELLDKGLANSM